jgi:hypothetical protein
LATITITITITVTVTVPPVKEEIGKAAPDIASPYHSMLLLYVHLDFAPAGL